MSQTISGGFMMGVWRLTEDEFIARIRRAGRLRRIVGVMFLAISIVGLSVGSWHAVELINAGTELAESLAWTAVPTDHELREMAVDTAFYNGLFVGGTLGSGLVAMFYLLLFGAGFVFTRDRAHAILLRLWDERREVDGDDSAD